MKIEHYSKNLHETGDRSGKWRGKHAPGPRTNGDVKGGQEGRMNGIVCRTASAVQQGITGHDSLCQTRLTFERNMRCQETSGTWGRVHVGRLIRSLLG